MADDKHWLIHMNQSVVRIKNHTREGESAFLASFSAQSATLWELLLICDAERRLSDELRAMHPEVDWHALRGLYDALVSDPSRVEPADVWDRVEQQIGRLGQHLREILISTHMK